MKKSISIVINGKEYTAKYSIRALFLFEQIAGHRFEITNTLESYLFLFSILLASNPHTELTWDEFLTAVDEDPTIIAKLDALSSERDTVEQILEKGDDTDPTDAR